MPTRATDATGHWYRRQPIASQRSRLGAEPSPDCARRQRGSICARTAHARENPMFRLSSSMKAVAVCCILTIVPAAARAQSDAKAEARVDVTGKWIFNVTTDAGTG